MSLAEIETQLVEVKAEREQLLEILIECTTGTINPWPSVQNRETFFYVPVYETKNIFY